ncbi:MAG: NADH-quinone oxidoreductase subunit NuoG [Thermodesulfobacteriota bacterium]
MVNLTIDEIEVEIEEGATILEAAQKVGLSIPTFCYHQDLLPFGACRLCVVEVEQMKGRFIPSCSTPATNGMVVRTNTPEIRNARKTLLELLLVHHPLDCPVCDKGGNCKLQDLVYEYELTDNRFSDEKFDNPIDSASHLVERNTNRCVLCGMCARNCDEVVGVSAISFVGRGFSTVIGTNFERELNCEFCGGCINICPVGALTDRLFKFKARVWDLKNVTTICSYCSTGCTITLGVKDNSIYRVTGEEAIGVNKGRLCSKGRFGYQYVSSSERITRPLVKKEDGGFKEVTWKEALERVAGGLKGVKEKHGADGIGGICSDRLTNEEAYLFQKFMRAALGTNNVDHAGGFSYSGLEKGLKVSLGYAASDITLSDVRNADVIFLVRSNLSETHPVAGYQVNMAVKRYGAKLIVGSSRDIKFDKLATVSLTHKPNTEVALINGIISSIVSENLYDQELVSSSAEGFEQLKTSVARYSGEYVEEVTGVKQAKISEAARLITQGKRVCILTSSGLGIQSDDEKLAQSIANLAILTGMVGKEGSGVGFLGEKNNSQGVLDMGVLPHLLPGYQEVSDEKVRGKFEEAWKVSLPAKPGQSALEMLLGAESGKIKALYLIGENPVITYPDTSQTKKALEALDFLVVQDLFLTPTARCADVVLPAASFAEKSGSYTNFERKVQRIHPGLDTLEGVKTDLEILVELSRKMGCELEVSRPEEVRQEVSGLVPLYAEIDHAKMGEEGIRLGSLNGENRVKPRFIPVEDEGKLQEPDSNYPLLLTTGSVLFHSGSLSTKSPELNQVGPGNWVEVNPEDASGYQLTDGQEVLVKSKRGEIKVAIRISKQQTKGTVFIPYHFEAQAVNLLTSKDLTPTFVAIKKA